MAEGYTGVPDVEPSTQAAGTYERIQVNPEAFGTGVGEALEGAGDKIMKTAQFYGTVAADNATNNYMDEANKVLYGDPTQKPAVGPDGTAATSPGGAKVYDGGFFSLRGADALNAQSGVYQKLNQIIAEQRATLPTPRSREQFDVDTRRLRARTLAEMGQHADTEYKAWSKSVNDTGAMIGLNDVSNVAADDAASEAAGQKVIDAFVKNAQLEGVDTKGAELKARQEIALARVRRLLGDPSSAERAQQVFDANKDVLGSLPNYDGIAKQVRQDVANQAVPGYASAFVDHVVAGAQGEVGSISAPGAEWSGIPKSTGGHVSQQIAGYAKAAGANDVETAYAQGVSRVESHDNPNAVNLAGTRFGAFQYPTHGTLQQQTVQAIHDGRVNANTLRGLGIVPNPSDLYLFHQQGAAGGKALVTAPQNMGAVAALTPAYHGNQRIALEAVAGNLPGFKYNTPEGRAAANAAASQMTVGQFRQTVADFFYGGKGKAPPSAGVGGAGQYPTLPDALEAHRQDIHDAAVKSVAEDPRFKDDPELQERIVDKIDREVSLRISRADSELKVSTDIVDSALANPDNPPTSMDELEAIPGMKQNLDIMRSHDPKGLLYVEARLKGNIEKAMTYGGDVYDFTRRVLADAHDPQAITRVTQLAPSIGTGPGAPLTGRGAGMLGDLIRLRTGPQGDAELHAIGTFNDNMHKMLSQSNDQQGVWDTKGEIAYTKFMAAVMPQVVAAAKQGPQALAKLLNPESPDYLGNAARPFLRSQAQMITDSMEYSGHYTPTTHVLTIGDVQQQIQGMSIAQRNAYARGLITSGQLAPSVWDAIVAGQTGAAKPAGPAPPVAPGPGGGYPLVAPAPGTQ